MAERRIRVAANDLDTTRRLGISRKRLEGLIEGVSLAALALLGFFLLWGFVWLSSGGGSELAHDFAASLSFLRPMFGLPGAMIGLL